MPRHAEVCTFEMNSPKANQRNPETIEPDPRHGNSPQKSHPARLPSALLLLLSTLVGAEAPSVVPSKPKPSPHPRPTPPPEQPRPIPTVALLAHVKISRWPPNYQVCATNICDYGNILRLANLAQMSSGCTLEIHQFLAPTRLSSGTTFYCIDTVFCLGNANSYHCRYGLGNWDGSLEREDISTWVFGSGCIMI